MAHDENPRAPRPAQQRHPADAEMTDPLGTAPVQPLDPTETLPAASVESTDPTETLPATPRWASASQRPFPSTAPVEHPTDVLPSLGGYQPRTPPYVAPQTWPSNQHTTEPTSELPQIPTENLDVATPEAPVAPARVVAGGIQPTTEMPRIDREATPATEAPVPDLHTESRETESLESATAEPTGPTTQAGGPGQVRWDLASAPTQQHYVPEPAPVGPPLPESPGYSARRQRFDREANEDYQRLEFGVDLTDADKRFLYVDGEPSNGYRRHKFYEFMGMRPEFLARYPQERAAVMGRFSLVFVTVICSFFGMYYTMYLAFNNSSTPNAGLIGLAIAFVFAAIIFVIDLSIIRDFSIPKALRRDFASTDFKGSGFGRNLFRVLISICIAIIVSHSLVIFFFRADIQADLAEFNQQNSETYVSQLVSSDPVLKQDLKKLSDSVAAAQTAYDQALATRDAQQICLTNERQGLSNSDVPAEQRCTIGTTSGVAGRAGAAVERETALADANTALSQAQTTLQAAQTAQTTGTTAATAAAQERAQATYTAGGKRESLIDQSKAFMRVANENKGEVYPIAISIAVALMAIDLLPLVAKYTLKTPMHNQHLTNLLLRSVSGSEAVRRARQHRNLEDVDYDNTVYTALAREEAKRVAELERIRNRELVTRFAHQSHALQGDQLASLDVSNVDRVARSTASFQPLPEDLRTQAPELRSDYVQHYSATRGGVSAAHAPGAKAEREILWESLDGHEQVVGTTRTDLNNGFVSQFDPGNPEAGGASARSTPAAAQARAPQAGQHGQADPAHGASDPDATDRYTHPLFDGRPRNN